MEQYFLSLREMSNQELLDEYVQLHYDSPEDPTSPEIVDQMIKECQKELLGRMK